MVPAAGRLPRSAYGIGRLAIRSQGIYFSMVTLALAQIVISSRLQAPWTGGEDGIQAGAARKLFEIINLQLLDKPMY